MKANGAPEKFYIQPSAIEELPHQNIVYTKPLADNSIEYTRTDAFIEKACLWLEKNIAEATGIDSYAITESFKQAIGE